MFAWDQHWVSGVYAVAALQKIDADFHCAPSVKAATAAAGAFQHRNVCPSWTLDKQGQETQQQLHNALTAIAVS